MSKGNTSPAVNDWQSHARAVARGIRLRVFEHTITHNGGYLSQACSAAELLATLYTHIMKLGPSIAPPVLLSTAQPPWRAPYGPPENPTSMNLMPRAESRFERRTASL